MARFVQIRFASLLTGFLVAWWCITAHGQVIDGISESQKGGIETTSRTETLLGEDVHYLRRSDGQLVPVLNKATFEEFSEWLATRGKQSPPEYSIPRLAIQGEIGADRADLTAEVDVNVNQADRWIRVSLRFPEGQLAADVTYRGNGENAPGKYTEEGGLTWWVRGKGKHKLTIPLRVPFNSKQANRRLVLGLPTSAVSSATLRIPNPRISVRSSDRTTITSQVSDSATEVELVGMENRLELVWQLMPATSMAQTLLEVVTTATVTLVENEGTTVEATQRIQAAGQQGGIEQIEVRLPEGMVLLRLDGPDVSESTPVPDRPGRYIIRLRRQTTTAVDLQYTLRGPAPKVGTPFVLDGFDVGSAGSQSGFIVVTTVGDLRAVRDIDEGRFVHRINPTELPTGIRPSESSLTFRFFKRMQLPLHFERVEPIASVDPENSLLVSPGHLELISLQKLQIRRGTLNRLKVRWPGRAADGWSIPTVDAVNGADVRIVKPTDDSDSFEVELADPARGSLTFRLRSHRDVPVDGGEFGSALPYCDVQRVNPSTVVLYVSSDLETELRGNSGQSLRAAPSGDRKIPAEAEGLNPRDERLIEGSGSRLTLSSIRHEQRIRTNAFADLTVEDSFIDTHLRFEIAVEFAPLREVTLSLPVELQSAPLEVRINDRIVQYRIDREHSTIVASVDPPVTGRVLCEMRYAWELPSDANGHADREFTVPLVKMGIGSTMITQVAIRDRFGAPISILGDIWRRQISPGGILVWLASQEVGEVSVEIAEASLRKGSQQIAKACLRTIVSGDGTIRTRAEYVVPVGVRDLKLTLPSSWKIEAAWWGGNKAIPRIVDPNRSGGQLWEIDSVGERAKAGTLITLDIEGPLVEVDSRGTSLRLPAPILSAERLPEVIMWQITVPDDQYLLARPHGFSAAYRWVRQGFAWNRRSNMIDESLASWIGQSRSLPAFEPDGDSHSYLFQTSRDNPLLVARFVSRVPLVLTGAGGALLVGLMVVRMKRFHNLPTAVAAAVGISLAAVGWTETVLLFLQPAILGGGLLVFYLVVDGLAQRGRQLDAPPSTGMNTIASTIAPQVLPHGSPSAELALRSFVVGEAGTNAGHVGVGDRP